MPIDFKLYEHLEPITDRVFVIRDPIRESTLHIPESAQERERLLISTGTVVAAGPGKRDLMGNLVPMPCKVGDRVALQPGAHGDIEVDGLKVVATEARLLIAIIHPPAVQFRNSPIDVDDAPPENDDG